MRSMVKKLKQKLRSRKKNEEWWFLENGSILLKELIADCNGKSLPIPTFSSDQILKATNNFDSSGFISQDALYEWYRGRIEDRSYMIKRYTEDKITKSSTSIEEVYNGIALSARMSNHSNFLKLLGCCLEFPFPVLVFEFAEHGVLNRRGGIMVNGEESLLPWSVRLKIAKEIANAVAYLHMAFPKIIIHRDVKLVHVFVDKNWTAKLSDLSFAISLPEGKSTMETDIILGTYGYLDPFYYASGFVTEYTDVFSFGICLFVFLTGKRAVINTGPDGKYQGIHTYVEGLCENGKLNEVIDPLIIKDITSAQKMQLGACVKLALSCCEKREEDRPKMIQVAKELKRIQTSL